MANGLGDSCFSYVWKHLVYGIYFGVCIINILDDLLVIHSLR